MCSDSASRRRTRTKKSSQGNFFSLRVRKPRYTPPVFWNLRSKFYKNVREAHERHAEGVPFLRPSGTPRPKGALSPPNLAFGKAGGQAHRSAPHKIPHKSPALPDFYTSARAVAARPRPPCGREGGIPSGFSGTGGVSRGDGVPPRGYAAAYPDYTQGGYEGVSSPSSCAAIPRSA